MHTFDSLSRVFFGLFFGSVVGVLLGLCTGKIKIIRLLFYSLFQFFRSFPPVAIIPLVIVWFGIGEFAKIFSISFAVFFPVWINTHVGASQIPAHYLQSASTLTPSLIKKWLNVILPASLPFIIPGIRVGISVAFIMVFVSELAGASSGVGYLISTSHLAYRIDQMVVGIFLLGFLGAFVDFCFVKTTRWLFPWVR